MKIRMLMAVCIMGMARLAVAADPVKVGVIVEVTGPQAEYGMQMTNGMKLYMQEHGDTVAGRKIELIVKDVGGPAPEVAKRLAQELASRDKVDFFAGFGFTPNALAAAPVATQAKIPMVVMNAASSTLTGRSPYIVRTSMTIAQNSMGIASWAAKNGIKRVFMLYADYGPGQDGASQFRKTFSEAGGSIVGEVAVPLKNPDFGPFLQRIKDAKPDAAFMWVPSGEMATALVHGYRERGLDKAGIKMISTSDAVDDALLNVMGDSALGIVTAGHYSVAHDSAENKAFLKSYQNQFGVSIKPNFMAVAGYDGMAAIYEVVKRLKGQMDGEKAMEILKGLKLNSPRGPIMIDPQTRDIIQTVYIRRVERRDKDLFNIEFDKLPNVKDPGK
ncbi:ABC transporter substrate-binding protein [Undibacterium sp. TJN25]|uniref:ABC transporter substrate-binding protein n=1 Tax=Undibacterium sp. TJN25 TaxID=3413056 RepID=UPI003BF1AB98